MRNSSSNPLRDDKGSQDSQDSRFNQTLRSVQGLLKGRSIPGKVLLTRRSDPLDDSPWQDRSPKYERSLSENDSGPRDHTLEDGGNSIRKLTTNASTNNLKSSTSKIETNSKEVEKPTIGARATDSARIMKFTKILSAPAVILDKLRELAWSGIPPYMRPNVWRLLLIEGREFWEESDLNI
ncbi:hypothetical protein SAY86_015783 [Trapa natans]|uniref:Rab-GAP TBC domain-containing protein n=1 Tax=Trapa natans TaxID=22666 RepID=A0AAN7QYV3_TRANT|nr:hypothetical protein SAY86_015783 [Trapa natans]